jgi:anti-anti-sigma factor
VGGVTSDGPAGATFHVIGPTLVVAGEIDGVTADAFGAALSSTAIREVDMSQVTFFNSTGIRVLLAARRARVDGDLVVIRPSRIVQRVLELAGLARHDRPGAGTPGGTA